MNRLLSGLLVVAIVIGGGYWYHTANSKCPVPIAYAIGTLDERFDLSEEEARAIVSEAESIWEDKTGRNLFTYAADAEFTINFIFDDRQRTTLEEHRLREVLDRTENISSSLREEYEVLLNRYESLKQTYENRLRTYENRLATYNEEVERWNDQGGAPADVYERLSDTEESLQVESNELSSIARKLNELVDSINELGDKSNRTIRDYNNRVAEYNDRFHEEREFTQGDYQDGRINIYQFKDLDELRLVLVHELGHALSLGHVENPQSAMYYLMQDQPSDLTLSEEDLAEFRRMCGIE